MQLVKIPFILIPFSFLIIKLFCFHSMHLSQKYSPNFYISELKVVLRASEHDETLLFIW